MIKNNPVFRCFAILFFALIANASFAQTIQDGINALENERFTKAKNIFSGLAKTGNSQAGVYLGHTYMAMGKPDSALTFYQQAGRGGSIVDPWTKIARGKALMLQGNAAAAKIVLDSAIKVTKGKNSLVMIQVAEASSTAKTKDIEYAKSVLAKAEEIDKKNPEVFLMKGDVWLAADNAGNAISEYNQAITVNPLIAKPHARIGYIYIYNYNAKNSLENLNKAVSIDASYAPAYRHLANLYYKSTRYEDALTNYKKYLDLTGNIDQVQSRNQYISYLFVAKKYANAVSEIESIMKFDTSDAVNIRLLGYANYELEDYEKSMTAMKRYFARKDMKILPSDYVYYGKALLKQKKEAEAVEYLYKALAVDSTNLETYDNLTEAFMGMKKYPEAIKVYQAKRRIGKEKFDVQDYYAMSKAYYFDKQYALADTFFKKVNELNPSYAMAYYFRAYANYNINQKEKAMEFYDLFLEKAQAEPDALKEQIITINGILGSWYVDKKDYDKGEKYFNQMLILDPANDKAKKNLDYIKQVRTGKP